MGGVLVVGVERKEKGRSKDAAAEAEVEIA